MEIERISAEVTEQASTIITSSVLEQFIIALAAIDGVIAPSCEKLVIPEIAVNDVASYLSH